MYSNHSLDLRLRKLEQRRASVQTMHILFGGKDADKHIGAYVVRTGGKDHLMERAADESWPDFKARADQHVTGILKLVTLQPVDEHGEPLTYDDWKYET